MRTYAVLFTVAFLASCAIIFFMVADRLYDKQKDVLVPTSHFRYSELAVSAFAFLVSAVCFLRCKNLGDSKWFILLPLITFAVGAYTAACHTVLAVLFFRKAAIVAIAILPLCGAVVCLMIFGVLVTVAAWMIWKEK